MTSIFDRIEKPYNRFRPASPEEFFALRLAQKLGEPSAASHYVSLASQYSREQLLLAYRRAVRPSETKGWAGRFHAELNRTGSNGLHLNGIRLLAIKVERRSIAAAVLEGNQLDYMQVRQLSSVAEKAEASAVGFINWLVVNFHIESAALEIVPAPEGIRRVALSQAVIAAFRISAIAVWEISKSDLLQAFGSPPVKSRKELRKVITNIWPDLNGNSRDQFLDAAALGLLVQTDRLFLH